MLLVLSFNMSSELSVAEVLALFVRSKQLLISKVKGSLTLPKLVEGGIISLKL